jgi:hypothetical protein
MRLFSGTKGMVQQSSHQKRCVMIGSMSIRTNVKTSGDGLTTIFLMKNGDGLTTIFLMKNGC